MSMFTKNQKFIFLKEKQKTAHNDKIREWFLKWDKTISAVMAVTVFFILLTCVIVSMKVYNNDSDNGAIDDGENMSKSLDGASQNLGSYEGVCTGTSEILRCTDIAVGQLPEAINYWKEMSDLAYVETLQLEKIVFEDGQIEHGWLQGINLKFQKLIIIGITTTLFLGKEAFSGQPFQDLYRLSLRELTVDRFTKEVFEGSSIGYLEITCRGIPIIEENAFGALSRKLESLQLLGCIVQQNDEDVLTNISGSGENFQALVELDLRYNTLGTIKNTSFKSAPTLKTLYLGDSTITKIEPQTFNSQYLEILDLRYNELQTVPENIFVNVKSGITILNNKWNCNCDLLWLKYFFINRREVFTHTVFYCNVNDKDISFRDVTFCNETTEDNTTSITTTTTTPTSIVPGDSITVECQYEAIILSSYEKMYPENIIKVRNRSIDLEFSRKANELYILKITGEAANNQNLLWINAEDKSDMYCSKDVSDGYQYEIPLTSEATYIFCIMSPELDTISPLDCGAKTVFPLRDDEPWITEKFKIPVICGICSALIATVIITGLIVFYCIRQHPSLIKGNKRVIIVESEAADAIVMPRTYYYNEISYKPPSFNSASNGYLEPRNNLHHHGIMTDPHLRTISENTAFVVPSTSGMSRTTRSMYRRRTTLEHCFDEHIYEPPPPLPPNHPLGLNYNDSLSRSYSRV